MRTPFYAFAIVAALMLVGCAAEPERAQAPVGSDAEAAPQMPDTIVAERGGFIPEGVEYDADHDRFLTGSLSEGSVFEIEPDGGVTAFVTDPDLVSSVGIEADEVRDRLLVTNSDRAVFDGSSPGQAKLGVYNLMTGERIAMVDLAASIPDRPADATHFANDVAVGDDGTAYVTDTRMSIVYAVSPAYEASVLVRFEPMEGLGLNGIVHPPGADYLLVAGGATLYKVPLDNPEAKTAVTLPEPVEGQDGMVWTGDGQLAIVSNSSNRVVALASEDQWASARVAGVARYDGQATTVAVVGDDLYVVHPHFADEEPPSLERVTLGSASTS